MPQKTSAQQIKPTQLSAEDLAWLAFSMDSLIVMVL